MFFWLKKCQTSKASKEGGYIASTTKQPMTHIIRGDPGLQLGYAVFIDIVFFQI